MLNASSRKIYDVNFEIDEREFINNEDTYISSSSECNSSNSKTSNSSSIKNRHYEFSTSNYFCCSKNSKSSTCSDNSSLNSNESKDGVDGDKLAEEINFINKTMEILHNEELINKISLHKKSSSASNNNKKLPTMKKKIIVMEKESDREFEIQCENFLSMESINKVIFSSRCCKFNCIQMISPNYQKGNYSESFLFAQSLRNEILGRSKEERAEKIYGMLKGAYYYIS